MSDPMDKLIALTRQAGRIVVFTGAGISTESGIPDFRGPGGVWEKYDPNDFHIDRFLASAESRRRYWQRSTDMYNQILLARPNAAHQAVLALERMGKLGAVITQNIDGLHQAAGTASDQVIELHGSTLYISCLSCGSRHDRATFQPKVSPAGDAPDCAQCGGLMKPATISFGQMLIPETLARAGEETDACDLFLVIGSSLVVYPAAEFPIRAIRGGAPLAIVNRQETPHDPYATVVLNDSAGEVMSGVMAALGVEAIPVAAPLHS
ncbi:MAG: Sir2 family NAD-dependent protein deacetylase [SAR324 cluster bacterium]|nr:Sir2 family NAD-dependent protein deacetylase [SAR324 cluster bacterium]